MMTAQLVLVVGNGGAPAGRTSSKLVRLGRPSHKRGTVWARARLVMEQTGPVATEAGVFSFVLCWDIA
jgi:hypothetical protein